MFPGGLQASLKHKGNRPRRRCPVSPVRQFLRGRQGKPISTDGRSGHTETVDTGKPARSQPHKDAHRLHGSSAGATTTESQGKRFGRAARSSLEYGKRIAENVRMMTPWIGGSLHESRKEARGAGMRDGNTDCQPSVTVGSQGMNPMRYATEGYRGNSKDDRNTAKDR